MSKTPFSTASADGGDLVAALQSLAGSGSTYTPKTLPAAKAAPGIPSRTGSSPPIQSVATTGGGGVASPITEKAVNGREYWPERTLKSTDGLIYAKYKPLKTLNTTDANGADVVFKFNAPT